MGVLVSDDQSDFENGKKGCLHLLKCLRDTNTIFQGEGDLYYCDKLVEIMIKAGMDGKVEEVFRKI